MSTPDIIAIAVIVLVLGAAVAYIVKEKTSGKKCIGCPYSSTCGKSKEGCSCHCQNDENSK